MDYKEPKDINEKIAYWASLTPTQRLANLYEMNKIAYGLTDEDMRKKRKNRKIRIIKYEVSEEAK